MRVFISISLSNPLLQEIKKIQDSLPIFNGKKTEIENLHLTLKFLGEVDEETLEEIEKKLSTIKFSSFKAELGEIGVFSEKVIKIIWIGLSGCKDLQKEIDFSLRNLLRKEKRFMGHLTIARVKTVKDSNNFIKDVKKISVPKLSFEVEEFKLMKSVLTKKGSFYSLIQNYPLEKENISLK